MALKRVCPVCNGAATDQYCEQTGLQYYGHIEDILGLFLSYEIYEATDPDEYTDLDDDYQEDYEKIMALGYVCLYGETRVKVRLWELFGAGTTTRANLQALIDLIEEPENVPPVGP